MMLEFYFQVLFCKFARIRNKNFSIPILQAFHIIISNVTVFRRVKYYDTVYRRIFYCFQTKRKEIYEVSFFKPSSVLEEAGIFMNVSMGGADMGQMKTC